MKLEKIAGARFEMEESITAAAISGPDELVALISNGGVHRYNFKTSSWTYLFSVKSDMSYSDGGFDPVAASTVYTQDNVVVIANDHGRHAYIHYPGKYHALNLWRGDYHLKHCFYPIALYKNDAGVPHLIYGEAWNHVQIMNLDTRQILTAAKSLIEENAEERHIEFYKKYNEDNKFGWPRPYDYFFGRLYVSPGQKRFLSAGWSWGSSDWYTAYDIDAFISNSRISYIGITGGEHERRAVCWIDADTVAVAFDPHMEGWYDGTTPGIPHEICVFRIDGKKAKEEDSRKIRVPDGVNAVSSKMYFEPKLNAFIIIPDDGGVLVLSLDGQVLLRDDTVKVDSYDINTGLFLKAESQAISVYTIKLLIL
ncbi:hypothetical protein ACTHGU_08585 [Chitinophagaceae bacterium MMS25-I14]